MADTIKYPIGIQTFSEIITDGYLYVDKTEMIYEMVKKRKYVFLSRPRRFGKSLLMSTIEAYFKGRKDLFSGLKIADLETEWIMYPVFRFDLSGGRFDDTDKVISHIDSYLREFEGMYGCHSDGDISVKFRELIRDTYHSTGKKVVILIDEYDKPMLDCLQDSQLHDAMREVLRGFYSVIKASDQYIKFAMLTGITKFGKVSVFSGINNLKDISMLPKYNDICGISESEFRQYFKDSIKCFAEETYITERQVWEQFKTMYDGYHFSKRGEFIYNPFSVLNAFDDSELGSYWYASGSPSYLIDLIERFHYPLDSIDDVRRNEIELSDISDLEKDLVPLLYQSGYLTIKDYEESTDEYVLGFPNIEVRSAFWSSLAKRFFRGVDGRSAFNVRDCVNDILAGNANGFMARMKALFADTNSEQERNKEIHFQNMMAIAAKMMGLSVRTEIHSSSGRCDMQILTDRYVYVFEFKIDGTPEEAIEQIHQKGYAVPFLADSRTVILIGANFLTSTRTIGNWIIDYVN